MWLLARQNRFVLMFVLLLLLWEQYTRTTCNRRFDVSSKQKQNNSSKTRNKSFQSATQHTSIVDWLVGWQIKWWWWLSRYNHSFTWIFSFLIFCHSERNEKRHCERKESLYNFAEKCISLEHPKTFQMVINVLLPFLWLEFSRYPLHRTANVQKSST